MIFGTLNKKGPLKWLLTQIATLDSAACTSDTLMADVTLGIAGIPASTSYVAR